MLKRRLREGSTQVSSIEIRQRLVAIFAADAAGYSRLMGMDEHATVLALDAARLVFRAKIDLNRGRIIDMAGDSVLAVFETATGAVLAALAVQSELAALFANDPDERRMRFRIGVHLGDVIEKADGTVYGDGVNIAARLQGLAEPGGITVSESIHTAVRGKVGAMFEDLGEQVVKNISHPVRAYRAFPAASDARQIVAPQSLKPGLAALQIDLSLPDKPSIAVLPFTNMSGDPEQAYFADGITEDIITELSRFRSLFVIARNSTFTYKGQAVDVRVVAKELGVRYVLEGSVRRAGNRVRVTGQLIDALTGNHLWAEKFDQVLEDIFAVQEAITRSIVAAIAPEIEASELARIGRIRPENLAAYQLGARAYAQVWEALPSMDSGLRDSGIDLALKALKIDPRNVSALSAIACAQWQRVAFLLAPDPEAAWQEGIDAANKAIGVDRADCRPYIWRGNLWLFLPDQASKRRGLDDARLAHALNPNDSAAMVVLGFGEALCGDPAAARNHMLMALRLSPRDPRRWNMYNILGLAAFLERDYKQGLEWSERSYAERPNWVPAHRQAMLNYVGLGRLEQARAEADYIRRTAPDVFAQMVDGKRVFFVDPEHNHRWLVFARIAAGLEDPAAAGLRGE